MADRQRVLRPCSPPPELTHTEAVDDSRIVEQFRALGDPIRWAIVRDLQSGTRCACVLADAADVSAPLLSHHLKVLRSAGLITGAKRGRWIDYSLSPEAFDLLSERLSPLVAVV
ncbi:MAG: winged helix-turn-helix transcriptional regulator [Actinobacteria bacterium]|nr:winged helix-turn-helix transcriptional regulator [Actinomycetota bacterium]